MLNFLSPSRIASVAALLRCIPVFNRRRRQYHMPRAHFLDNVELTRGASH